MLSVALVFHDERLPFEAQPHTDRSDASDSSGLSDDITKYVLEQPKEILERIQECRETISRLMRLRESMQRLRKSEPDPHRLQALGRGRRTFPERSPSDPMY